MDFEALVKEFCAAVEAGDGARLAALFTADGEYHDNIYGQFTGPAEIAEMLEGRFYAHGERFLWEPRAMAVQGDTGFFSWIFSFTSTLPEAAGQRVVVEGMSQLDLKGGKILRYTEKGEEGSAMVQLGFPPERIYKLLRRRTEGEKQDPRLARHR